MASKSSEVAGELVRALALRLSMTGASPLTPMHIRGIHNAMTDIPSRSFGSEKKWHCKNDTELLNLFHSSFPLPEQASWTVYRPSTGIYMRVLSVLRMQATSMDVWRRLPKRGRHIGEIGAASSHLWEWTLTFRELVSQTKSGASLATQALYARDSSVAGNVSKLQQSLARLQPLERRSRWTKE